MDDDFGAAAVSTPALPPNWRSAKAADGKEYYFNELTGETSWTFPSGNGAAAPSAPEALKYVAPYAQYFREKLESCGHLDQKGHTLYRKVCNCALRAKSLFFHRADSQSRI